MYRCMVYNIIIWLEAYGRLLKISSGVYGRLAKSCSLYFGGLFVIIFSYGLFLMLRFNLKSLIKNERIKNNKAIRKLKRHDINYSTNI
jgi:hypothetical protein